MSGRSGPPAPMQRGPPKGVLKAPPAGPRIGLTALMRLLDRARRPLPPRSPHRLPLAGVPLFGLNKPISEATCFVASVKQAKRLATHPMLDATGDFGSATAAR